MNAQISKHTDKCITIVLVRNNNTTFETSIVQHATVRGTIYDKTVKY